MAKELLERLHQIVEDLVEEGVPSELAATIAIVAAEKFFGRHLPDDRFLALFRWLASVNQRGIQA